MNNFKNIAIIILMTFVYIKANGQDNKKIALGLNIFPIIANSYEIVGEYRISKNWNTSLKFGYAGKNGMRFQIKVDDSFDDETNSGYFSKFGVEYITKIHLFIGTNLIISHYQNSGIDNSTLIPKYVETEGTIVGIGMIFGYRKKINNWINLDYGLQISKAQKRTDYVGYFGHCYQPGLGPVGEFIFLQGMVNLTINIK